MKWHEIPVKKYLSGLTYASENENEFRSNYVGIEPFIPTADELSMLQEFITERTKSRWLPMERNLALSLNPSDLASKWINQDIKYHFEKEYLQNDFTLIHCPYRRGMNEEEKDSVRLGIIEDLVEDAVMSNVIESSKKWLHDNGIEIKADNAPKESDTSPVAGKLEWIASPAALGYLIEQLVEGGYIKKPARPTKCNENINYSQLARQVLSSFAGDTGTVQTLMKTLNKNSTGKAGRLSKLKQTCIKILPFGFMQSND